VSARLPQFRFPILSKLVFFPQHNPSLLPVQTDTWCRMQYQCIGRRSARIDVFFRVANEHYSYYGKRLHKTVYSHCIVYRNKRPRRLHVLRDPSYKGPHWALHSVRPVFPIFSIIGKLIETNSNLVKTCSTGQENKYREANLRSKGQRSRSLGTKCKNLFFAHMFVKSGSIYVKPKPKWSAAHCTHVVEYISASKMT